MSWLCLNVQISESDAAPLSDLFLGWGALSSSIEYLRGDNSHEPVILDGPSRPRSGMCTLKVLLDQGADVESLLRDVKSSLAWEQVPGYSVETVEDRDWVSLTQRQTAPVCILDRLWIVPTWQAPPDPDALIIRLDPGQAFGTGIHPTTRLCLEWLVREVRGGEFVVDYGCGSGILAIAALKLGARKAAGIDTDPLAIETSAANARLNGLDLALYLPDEAPEFQADLVAANILANPLKELAPRLAGHTRTGGAIAVSGILKDQAQEISMIYSKWFDLCPPILDDGWAFLSGKKRGSSFF